MAYAADYIARCSGTREKETSRHLYVPPVEYSNSILVTRNVLPYSINSGTWYVRTPTRTTFFAVVGRRSLTVKTQCDDMKSYCCSSSVYIYYDTFGHGKPSHATNIEHPNRNS